MTSALMPPVAAPPPGIGHASPLLLDTTGASLLHRLARSTSGRSVSLLKGYVLAVSITYLPLLVGALLSPNSVIVRSATPRLPFLCDWSVAFMFLVSFPTLALLTITDDDLLNTSLHRVLVDGTLEIPESAVAALTSVWKERFRQINIAGYITGVVAGLLVACCNYIAYSPPIVGYWIASHDELTLAGYVFLYCIFLFYALVSIYILRTMAIALFLKDIVRHAQLHMLPAHPDKCGGLRPVGRLGLRNQYALTAAGLNVVLLAVVSARYLNVGATLYALIATAAVAYVILGPVVFLAPMLSFRTGMLRAKTQLMSEVAQRLRVELERLRRELPAGTISKDDEEFVERLRKIGAVIDELPVWPFDAGTLRKFLTAYVMPLVGAIGYPVLRNLLGVLTKWLAT